MRIVCIVSVLLLRHSGLFGQAGFFRKDLAAGDRPSTVVVGDFNGDARPDMAVSSFSGLSVLLNAGGGSFARPMTIPAEIHPMFGPTPAPYTVAADFNRDGRLDLVGAVDATDPPLRDRRERLGSSRWTCVCCPKPLSDRRPARTEELRNFSEFPRDFAGSFAAR